jgi:hypothetical protein
MDSEDLHDATYALTYSRIHTVYSPIHTKPPPLTLVGEQCLQLLLDCLLHVLLLVERE